MSAGEARRARWSESPTLKAAAEWAFPCDCTEVVTCGPCDRRIYDLEYDREYGSDDEVLR